MAELREEFGLTYLFIAHDLSVVYHICDRIAVMYLGDIAEVGSSDQVFQTPQHPYARALLSAVPRPDPRGDRRKRIKLEGDIPTPLKKPSGCGFRTRCPVVADSCGVEKPTLQTLEDGRSTACPRLDVASREMAL